MKPSSMCLRGEHRFCHTARARCECDCHARFELSDQRRRERDAQRQREWRAKQRGGEYAPNPCVTCGGPISRAGYTHRAPIRCESCRGAVGPLCVCGAPLVPCDGLETDWKHRLTGREHCEDGGLALPASPLWRGVPA